MKNVIKLFGWVVFILILSMSTGVNAHIAPENENISDITANLVQPDIFVAEYKTPIWISVKDVATEKVLNNLNTVVEIERINYGIIAKDIIAKQKGEEYMFEFSFPESGEYKIHFNTQNSQFDFPIIVDEPSGGLKSENLTFYIFAGLGILILIFGIIKKKYKLGVIWFLILIALGGLLYSLIFTNKQDTSNGIVTCPKAGGECVWTAHIHAYVPINICGEYYRLPNEIGPLNVQHTHEEKNIAHWHDQLPYDQKTKSIKNIENISVKSFFKEIGVAIGQDFINDDKGKKWKNGDVCPNGKIGSLKAFLNGKENKNILNYIWRDKDVIYFEFSDRDVIEIQKELKENPINFPTLGRG